MYTPPPAGLPDPTLQMRTRLRPMGIGDILDATFSLYRANFSLFVATVAIVEVPLQIIIVILQLAIVDSTTSIRNISTGTGGLTQQQTDTLVHWLTAVASVSVITGIITAIALVIQSAALAVVISNRYLNRAITVGDAYRAAVNRLGPLLVAIIWTGIRLILLGIACVVLIGIPFFIYFSVAWSLIAQVIMLENGSGTGASGRSRQLISGFWWKTLGLLVITAILVGILGGIPSAIISGAMSGADLGARTLVSGIVGAIVTILLRPIQTGATTLLFYDLKIRKEAFDLEAMARHLGVAAPEAPTSTWQ